MGAYFTISSIIYTGIFLFYFFKRNTLKTFETRIYKVLLVTTFIGLWLDAISFFAYELGLDPNGVIYQFLAKGVLLYFIVWIFSFTYYIYVISYSDMEDIEYYKLKLGKFKNALKIIGSIIMLVTFVIPISFEVKNEVIFPIGFSVDLTYMTVGLGVLACLYFAFKNIKHIVIKKYTPLFAMVILVSLSALIQKIFPELFLVNFSIATIVLLLFFSIENPDIKVINELTYSKELLKRANKANEKNLSLLTNELDKPLKLLGEFANKKISVNEQKETVKEIKKLQLMAVDVIEQINGVFELSKLENENSKLDKYDYNTKELKEEIKHLLQTKGRKINLVLNINDDLYPVLKGDALKIKQTVVNIYNYLIEKCYINELIFKINDTNTKTNTRLKFSFIIPKIDNYSQLFSGNSIEIEIINRLIELQNAKLEVYNKDDNTIIEFLINQNKVDKYNEEILKEEDIKINYRNYHNKNILIVDDNYEKINYLINLLTPYNVNIDIAHNHDDYENKLYSNKEWDLIFLDDMMPDSDKFEFLKLDDLEKKESLNNIKTLTNKDFPLVLMVTPNKYIKKYQYDYLIKPIEVIELDKVMKKYLE